MAALIGRALEEQSQLFRQSTGPERVPEWETLMVGNSREMCKLQHMIRIVGGRKCRY
jgi:hypothetical protein